MPELGTSQRPLRAAIVGSGPSGFYAAEALFKPNFHVQVDMFERLPAPYGLVRYGVAPDHPKIKNVIKVYEKIVEREGLHFYGHVEVGKDISVEQLQKFYDVIIFAYGAETDRHLNIPGEGLAGSHTATEFVAWYNGRPEYRDRKFDLSHERAVIVGQGNVAVDVCRILSKSAEEFKNTDICQHALEVLSQSKIKEIYMIGRRGPAQAAFAPVEIREFVELHNCDVIVDPKDLELNAASQKELEDPRKNKNFEILKQIAQTSPKEKKRKIFLQFFKSPVELQGQGRVQKIILGKNKLTGEAGQQKAQGTGVREEFDCGIVFRSVGYRGIAISGVPFDEKRGVIPNVKGRVLKSSDSKEFSSGLYCVGWIKRGPSGVIGTNKADADETAAQIFEDLLHIKPPSLSPEENVFKLLKQRNIRVITFQDWKKIDTAEIKRGEAIGKPREKFVSVGEMLALVR